MSNSPTPEVPHRAGYVALVGRPNAGKSTLMNALLDQHLTITSKRPQTTRQRVTGVLNGQGYQAILVDTPGVLPARDPLQKVMVNTTEAVLRDADLVIYLLEVVGKRKQVSPIVLGWLESFSGPVILALNKVDRVAKETLLPLMAELDELHNWVALVPISALKREGLTALTSTFAPLLPAGPPLFPADALSEQPERFFVAEFVREQLVRRLSQELPYAVAVEIESYGQGGGIRRIEAKIVVERTSQKGMVIGQRGRVLKEVGSRARANIEAFLGESIYLGLRVVVDKNWSDNPMKLTQFGYRTE